MDREKLNLLPARPPAALFGLSACTGAAADGSADDPGAG